jgi:NTP pyrophosphatase (non-canonical NTP hydrolase)
MNLVEYERFVVGLMSDASTANLESKLQTAAIGICAESGEFLDHIKKILFHGSSLEEHKQEMVKELGDVLFYTTFAANVLDFHLGSVEVFSSTNLPLNKLLQMCVCAGRYAENSLDALEYLESENATKANFDYYNPDLTEALESVMEQIIIAAAMLNVTMQDVIDGNVAKLSARYKDKKFTVEEFKAKELAKNNG